MQNTLDQSIVILAGRVIARGNRTGGILHVCFPTAEFLESAPVPEIPTVTLTAPLQRIFTSGLSALSTEPGAPCLGRR
jgi:hypothetical protein